MPVQIQCTSVIIRNDSLDRVLDGGAENFGSIAPNAMSYSDDRLSQASFMSPVDADEFAKSLELRGLDRDADTPDFVIVQAHDQSVEPACDWLILFEYEQRLIATMRGNESRTVIASEIDADYNPDSVQHYSAEDIERLFEFVERKDNIDTYRNKETGELVYDTRKTETPDELFVSAFDTVWQLRREAGTPPRSGDDASKVQETIECLQSLAANHPSDARVALALGMAWFAIGKDDQSQRQLTRAVELESDNTIMLKELGSVSLTRGDFPVALDAATKAVTIRPDDIELLGNLAVIQLLSGNVAEAKVAIEHAVHLQPEDEVNRNVQSVIAAVAAGKRERPTSLEEMMQPAKPKTWLARLIGG